jgi:hypothetical protein
MKVAQPLAIVSAIDFAGKPLRTAAILRRLRQLAPEVLRRGAGF